MEQNRRDLMWSQFKALGPSALVLNHYDLAEQTGLSSESWGEFLNDPEIDEWITSEMMLIQKSELKKMTKDISDSNSVGQAQLMSMLMKLSETDNAKSGPAFIYCYVPLNADQEKAENTIKLEYDPFMKELQKNGTKTLSKR